MTNDDLWTPSLMSDLRKARSGFMRAYDCAWRRERMFRYIYWISAKSHPPFNMVGSWRDDDIRREIQLWQEMAQLGIDDDEVVDEITLRLESRFAMTLPVATAAATFPGLAAAGMPIWNDAVGCLLPQELGPLRINVMTDFETAVAGQGFGYAYHPHEPEAGRCRADLFIYTLGEESLGTGIRDARVAREASRAWSEVTAALEGWSIPPDRQIGPAVESLRDLRDRDFAFVGVAALMTKDDADDVAWTSLSLTALNGAFLKVRYTVHIDKANAPRMNEDIVRFNSDVASFCTHFAPQLGVEE